MAGLLKGHKAALGFQTHSGWACAILAAGKGSDIEIVHRCRVILYDPMIDGAKQPFHTAEPMPIADAENYISRCRNATDQRAREAMTALQKISEDHGMSLSGACVIAASGRELPGLQAILASHALIHAAEGEFYRNTLLSAAKSLKINAQRLNRREAAMWVASRLDWSEELLVKKLGAIGRKIGRPWTLDEKLATMAAWLMLAK
jgi:hypothetical protein